LSRRSRIAAGLLLIANRSYPTRAISGRAMKPSCGDFPFLDPGQIEKDCFVDLDHGHADRAGVSSLAHCRAAGLGSGAAALAST
jgi:hypothetical protein